MLKNSNKISQLIFIKYQSRNSHNNSISASLGSIKDNESNELALKKENAYPIHFAKARGFGSSLYSLVPGKNGKLLADYVLFEESMKKVKVPWICYNKMTSQERTIYIKHLKTVEARELFYKCPFTGEEIKTITQLIYDGKCCGIGCRHCPYNLEECDQKTKKSLIWNGAYYL